MILLIEMLVLVDVDFWRKNILVQNREQIFPNLDGSDNNKQN